MKKTLTLLLLVCSALAGTAQSTKELLTAFTEKITGYITIEMSFSLTFDQPSFGAQNYTGTLLCHGKKYRLLTDALDVYSDGRNKWLCNKETKEVIVQYLSEETASMDITDHPLHFLTAYASAFSYHQKNDSRIEDGKTVVDILFFPKDKKAPYTSIQLTLDPATALPHAIQYTTKGGRYTIHITRITPNVEVFDGYFAYPKHRYPTFEIIDLR